MSETKLDSQCKELVAKWEAEVDALESALDLMRSNRRDENGAPRVSAQTLALMDGMVMQLRRCHGQLSDIIIPF